MAKSKPFGGKRAAPFKAGGGRKAASPKTAKGKPRKRG
jgi:hypothetical protein